MFECAHRAESRAAAVNPYELSIIHFNDFHARFEPVDAATSGRCKPGDEESCVGGFARLFTLISRLREQYKNNLVLNAGDVFTGSLWFTLFKWNVTSTFMNMIPQDAMTIGNHEFDTFVSGLVLYLKAVKYPVVAANIDATDEPALQPLFKKSTIVTKNGKRIGIVGYVTRDYYNIAEIGKLKILDELECVNAEAERLVKEDHVDIVIALSHSGIALDKEIAKSVKHVSIIVGGHSHTFLYTGVPPCPYDKPEDTYPVNVTSNVDNRTVLVVQAMAFSRYVGLIHLEYNDQGQIISWTGDPILMDKHIQQDKAIVTDLVPWKEQVDLVGEEVKGETAVFLDASHGACFLGECNMGVMILDAMVQEQLRLKNEVDQANSWTFASIAILNSGGIRSSITEGNITYADVLDVLPFEDNICTMELKGDIILSLLEFSTCDRRKTGPLQFGGIKAVIDYSKPNFGRVSDVMVLCAECRVPKFEPIKTDKWYRVVINEFTYHGGDGFAMIEKNARNFKRGRRDTDVLFSYLTEVRPIVQIIPGNVQFKNVNTTALKIKYRDIIATIS